MNKTMVVVLGSGRSGTSLMMQVLHGLGMSISENLVAASVANPPGPYEDAEIFQLHASLISELAASVAMPMPQDWLKEKPCFRAINALATLIQTRLDGTRGIFGFKDPKTSMLIPLWVRVFNQSKITPIYILAVREPSSTISSYLRQYNQPAQLAELIWLVRTIEALDNTGADCFILHYEEWFSDPKSLAQGLLRYTGLDQDFKGNLSDVMANTVKPNLNRASMDDYVIQNPYVLKLYAALKECHGADFDRKRLMAEVKECRQAMEGFKGWYLLAHQANVKLADMQARLEKTTIETAKVKALEERLQTLEKEKLQSGKLAVELQKLQRQLDQLMTLSSMR